MVCIASQMVQIARMNKFFTHNKKIRSPLAVLGIEGISRAQEVQPTRGPVAAADIEENNVSTNITKPKASTVPNDTSTFTTSKMDSSSTGEQEAMTNQTGQQQNPATLNNDQVFVINATSSTTTNSTSTTDRDISTDPVVPYWKDDDPMVATMDRSAVKDFERQERVVIATKVQGDQEYQIADVKQSMCLLTAAYNNRVHYDIVVFTSHPWEEADVKELESIVAPANVKIVMDSLPLPDVVRAMSESGRQKLLDRCYNVTEPDDFHWHMLCDDGKLRYNWQAEFRTKHVWTNPALAGYKYMLWMDSDGHSGAKWNQDPIATMVRNELVLLFDNFPGGTSRLREIRERINKAFNTTVHCGIGLEDGHLVAYQGTKCILRQVHGFFHATNLGTYEVHGRCNILLSCLVCFSRG